MRSTSKYFFYVLAVVMFYGLILLIALMGQRTRWCRQIRLEDNHSSHIDCHEIVRKYTVLRQKIDMLWLSGIHRRYMLDSFRRKSNMSFAFDWYDIGIYNSFIMKLFKPSSLRRTAWYIMLELESAHGINMEFFIVGEIEKKSRLACLMM